MLWFVLACAAKVAPVPQLQMGSPAPKTKPPEGETAPTFYGRMACGLTVGFQGVDERFVASVLTPEGELVVVSEALKSSYEATLAVSLEEAGVPWFSVVGAGDDEDTPISVSQVDGGYLVAGSTWSHGAGMSDAWMAKLEGSKVVWQRTYGLYDRDVGLGFVPGTAGGLLVSQIPDYGLMVQVVDALGGVESVVGIQGAYGSMRLIPHGEGAVVYGTVLDEEARKGHARGLGRAGETLWTVDLEEGAPVEHALAWEENTLLVIGGERPRVDMVGPMGLVVSTWSLPTELDDLRISGGRMTSLGPVLIGQAEDGSRVVQLDVSGQVVWSQTLAKVAIFDVQERDGEVVVLGHGEGASSQDLFAVRLDGATGGSVCVALPPDEPDVPEEGAEPDASAEPLVPAEVEGVAAPVE